MHRLFFYVFGATIRLDGVKERSLALIPSTFTVSLTVIRRWRFGRVTAALFLLCGRPP
jgi:hypothetical protein